MIKGCLRIRGPLLLGVLESIDAQDQGMRRDDGCLIRLKSPIGFQSLPFLNDYSLSDDDPEGVPIGGSVACLYLGKGNSRGTRFTLILAPTKAEGVYRRMGLSNYWSGDERPVGEWYPTLFDEIAPQWIDII